ncbi:MAG TPA: DUF3866 family protein [Actinomycetota bacterium]|nr:DUF3866 family protein [Actinomycetota bacterium]
MIRLRTGTVTAVAGAGPGLRELTVEVDGASARAVAYPALTGAVEIGDRVLLNTTAVARGLGTGGVHFVVASLEPRDADPPEPGHVLKLRYTPLQAKVQVVEEHGSPHRAAMAEAATLGAAPVVWAPLHSMVAAACAGARAAGAERIAYLMTDGAALPAWFSRQVHALRETDLVEAVITCGQALGGDLEAVNVFSGLLAAHAVVRADVVVVADGPGKVGTDTRWGASDVASAMSLNAAGILGGRPVAALRVNFADPAYRHHGVSPHSLTALGQVALVPVHVAVPALGDERRAAVWKALKAARLEERHQLVEVNGAPAVDLLRERGLAVESMGRSLEDEPAFFEAAGAAGVLAGRMAAGSSRWRREAGAGS